MNDQVRRASSVSAEVGTQAIAPDIADDDVNRTSRSPSLSVPTSGSTNSKRIVLAPCSLCGLMIGYRRQRFHCQFCPQATCQFCVEIGANGTFWCGGCLPSTQTLQLAQSAAFIKPPARIGRNGKVTGTPSPSLDRENQASPVASPLTFFGTNPATPLDPDLVPKCLLCSQKFNVFNWRKVCDGCKLVICDKCCKKVRGVLGAGSRADSQKEGLLCVKCVTPR